MVPPEALGVPRRHFLTSLGAVGLASWVAPRHLFAIASRRFIPEVLGPVEKMRQAAATDPITVQLLRGKMSVVAGNGGNVAVLPGQDGVLLVDSGIVGRRVAQSVAGISKAP